MPYKPNKERASLSIKVQLGKHKYTNNEVLQNIVKEVESGRRKYLDLIQ